MAIANGVGWIVRGMGSQAAKAKALDPEHRRDGAGLFLIGLSILLGVAIWADSAGPLGAELAFACRFLIGAVAAALPILFFVAGVRLMRSPGDPAQRGRSFVGWVALFASSTGVLEITQHPVDFYQRMGYGGVLGWAVGFLQRAVTAWVAVPLLGLLFLFGVLVITATPINKIP